MIPMLTSENGTGEQLLVYQDLCTGLQGKAFLPDCLAPVFHALSNNTYGANLMGAGSGGFILGVLRGGCTREAALEEARAALCSSPDAQAVVLSLEEVELVV